MNQSEIILNWQKTLQNLKKEPFYKELKEAYKMVDDNLKVQISEFNALKIKVESLHEYDLSKKEQVQKLITLKDELLMNPLYKNIIRCEREFNDTIKNIEMTLFISFQKGSCA